jgi:hypothetical protein
MVIFGKGWHELDPIFPVFLDIRADLVFAFGNEIVTSHTVISKLGLIHPDPSFEGRIHEAS